MGAEEMGYDTAVGTYEDAKAMIGYSAPPKFGEVDVNPAMIRHFAAMVRDGNAGFWDEEFARRQWGGVIAPGAMLMVWVMSLEWKPGAGMPQPLIVLRIPLPGDTIVNVSNEAEFFRPVRVGDRLNVVEEVLDVSEEKTTRMGAGHFVTTLATWRDQLGNVMATNKNVLFRFTMEKG